MARTKQASHEVSYLSVTIQGYKGYMTWEDAQRSDRALSEEVLTNMSDAMATVKRMLRENGDSLDSNVVRDLSEIEEKFEAITTFVSDSAPVRGALEDLKTRSKIGELTSLDYLIIEKVGYITQTLSAMELEEGVGISPDGPESVGELIDDLGDLLKERGDLITN